MTGNITFSGLFSGLSTDQIIASLVNLQRTPITQLENLSEQDTFEKTAYQSVNTQTLSLQKTLLAMRLQSTFLSKLATSSNESLLGITADFNAQPGSHSVTIQSIARGASAISGLGNRALERAAAKLVGSNTAGITGLAMTANTLGSTRALSQTVLQDTQQTGDGSAAVTAGDQVQINVTLKGGGSNTVNFTFAGDATDTVERLRQAIVAAFQGEAQVTVDSNGAFLITETDPTAAGSLTLNSLTFKDNDYSGSTFTVAVGGTTAGGSASSRTIVGTRTFTTGSSANVATGAETLISLDQWSGGAMDGDETINISGTKYDGTAVSTSFAVTAATTLNDLIAELQTRFNDAPNPPWETTVTLENGKIVFRDQATGSSETSASMYFDDPDNTLNLGMGTFVTVDQGSSDISQTIRTSSFTVAAKGRHLVTSTEGRGGVVTGTVSLNSGTALTALGVIETNLFTIDRDDGSGIIDPVTVFGLTPRSTVQDLIEAINAQVPTVTAQLVDDGAGAYYLQIAASEGGVDFRLTDESTGVGILEKVLNPDITTTDTDISTLSDAALASVDAATTSASDYTFTTIFTPANGGPVQRRAVVGTDGTAVIGLIGNTTINGAGNNFGEGVALIYTNQSSELNVSPATSAFTIGSRHVSDATRTATPSLNIYTYASESGLDVALTSGTFSINGTTITIDNTATQTLDEIMGTVNSSGAGVVMEYDRVQDRFLIYRPDAGNTDPITLGGVGDTSNFFQALGLRTTAGAVQFSGTAAGTVATTSALSFSNVSLPIVSGTFTINGVKITVNAAVDSLEDVISRINNATAGVTASYDTVQDRLILQQDLTEQPLYDRMLIGDATDTSNFLSAMRLTDTYQTSQYIGSSRVKALFTVDGEDYTRDLNTVDNIITGVTLSLKGKSTDPIAVDITSDTSRATKAVRDFVVEYNKLVDLVHVKALTDDERVNLTALTDTQRSSMTSNEIDDYETQRSDLWLQEMLHRSTLLNRMDSSFRMNMFSPVTGVASDKIRMLSELGINTGTVGLGVDLSRTGKLVDETNDPDVILQKLQDNAALQDALENRSEEIFNLFSSDQTSSVEVLGNKDLTYGVTLSAPLSFSIGNGSIQTIVTLGTGFHTGSSILSDINNALADVGLNGEIRPYFTTGGFLQLVATTDTGRSRISIQDLAAGSGLAASLGVASQTVAGVDASSNAGLSRRLDAMLKGYVGTGGVISERIKIGGFIDQDLLSLSKRITDYEYRLSLYETRLRSQFAAMEVALASFQTTSQFLTANLNAASTGTSSKSSGGISLSV